MIPPKRFDIFPPFVGCSEGLDAFRFFFKDESITKQNNGRHRHKNMKYNKIIEQIMSERIVRPSFMGIVFGVYRNWIWEFGDLRSYTPILWGSIWPNTIISNPIKNFPLGSVVFGTQIRWTRGKSYLRDSI